MPEMRADEHKHRPIPTHLASSHASDRSTLATDSRSSSSTVWGDKALNSLSILRRVHFPRLEWPCFHKDCNSFESGPGRAFCKQEVYEAVDFLKNYCLMAQNELPELIWKGAGKFGNFILVLIGSLCLWVKNLRLGTWESLVFSSFRSLPSHEGEEWSPQPPAQPHTPAVLVKWPQLVSAAGRISLPKSGERHSHPPRSPPRTEAPGLGGQAALSSR